MTRGPIKAQQEYYSILVELKTLDWQLTSLGQAEMPDDIKKRIADARISILEGIELYRAQVGGPEGSK